MNARKTLKNSVISVIGQVFTLLLQFINRRVFVQFLDIEYLGYHSVFGNIFSILSFAELGVGGIISFHLYKEFAEDNTDEIGRLMYLYKWIYRFISGIVLGAGLIASVFVPYIVRDASQSLGYLYIVYFLQLASVVAEYLLSYRRTIYQVDQKEYKCIEVDLYTLAVLQTIQLGLLVIFKNYLLYLCVQLSTAVVANFIIYMKTNREYPYLRQKYKILREDIRQRNMVSDLKNFIIHKIAYVIYSGTDSIVISSICGIRDVALYGNYMMLQRGVTRIALSRLLNPVQAAIGNIVYSKREKSQLWNQFEMLDVFSFFFASMIGIGFLVFYQPAIQIWLGEDYLLPFSFVVTQSLTIYFLTVWEIVYKYRSAFGEYKKDKNCMLISAALNIVFSVVLAFRFGLTGVQIGTIFGFLAIAYGRIRFVVKGFFNQSVFKYLLKHTGLLLVVCMEGVIVQFLTRNLTISVIGFCLRLVVWAVVPLLINTMIYYRNEHFREMCRYMKMFLLLFWEKFRQAITRREKHL